MRYVLQSWENVRHPEQSWASFFQDRSSLTAVQQSDWSKHALVVLSWRIRPWTLVISMTFFALKSFGIYFQNPYCPTLQAAVLFRVLVLGLSGLFCSDLLGYCGLGVATRWVHAGNMSGKTSSITSSPSWEALSEWMIKFESSWLRCWCEIWPTWKKQLEVLSIAWARAAQQS